MTDPKPSGPDPSKATQEYWNGTKDNQLRIPYCTDCEEYFFYPRHHCPTCMSESITHREASGRGELVTYSTVIRPPSETYQELAPYINGIVELEEGVRLFTNILAEDESELANGLPVSVTFVETDTEYKLPYFEPA